LEPFLVSAGVVALAEIGDKTQLLAFVLAARFRKPAPIIAGILVATLANHTVAGAIGSWMTSQINPSTLRVVLGVSFVVMAIWTLVPDRLEEADAKLPHASVFVTTIVAFFVAEIGDKTQIATVALAARFHAFAPVVAGTTLGMMIANVPAVLVGGRLAHRVPIRLVHTIAAVIFIALGVATLLGAGA
jgi:putative Ca2+/H+ antiporter (TMEM165/GDT1 family)